MFAVIVLACYGMISAGDHSKDGVAVVVVVVEVVVVTVISVVTISAGVVVSVVVIVHIYILSLFIKNSNLVLH
jgi:hypothetical protein